MGLEARTAAGGGKEIRIQNRARYLTPGELVARARNDLSGLIGNRKLRAVDRFVEDKITGVQLNGVDVISIDVDHDTKIDAYIKAYMKAPRTALIMPEFFYPELVDHAGILARPMKKIKQRDTFMYGARLQAAERVEQALREAEKPVAVADIADRGSYVASNYFLRLFPLFLGGAIALATKQDLAVIAGALAGMGHASNTLHKTHSGTGIFDKDADSGFERHVLDLEQARRLSVAFGVRQLTTELKPTETQGDEVPQIVMLNPKAHGRRVADILVNPHPKMDKALSRMYRLVGPNLHHAIRRYEWEKPPGEAPPSARQVFPAPDGNPGGWRKIEERKVRI